MHAATTTDVDEVGVGELAAAAHAALVRLLIAVVRVVDGEGVPIRLGWSPEEWLAHLAGTSTQRARTMLAVARRLLTQPTVLEAAGAGALSIEQLIVIVPTVHTTPTAADELLSLARRSSLGELRDRCARITAASDPDPDARHRRLRRARRLRRWRDPDGTEHLHASGPAELLDHVDRALRPHLEAIFEANRAAGTIEPSEARAFDALVALASGSSAREGQAREPVRYLSLLRIDLAALQRGCVEGEEVCEINGLGPIPVSVARELLGQSILKLVITRGVNVANVTHLGRGPTVAQRVALLWQQPECTREGCNRKARLEVDHREGWAATHVTRLDALDPLCRPDHDRKTRDGWALVEGRGKRPLVPPEDPRHPEHRPPAPPEAGAA